MIPISNQISLMKLKINQRNEKTKRNAMQKTEKLPGDFLLLPLHPFLYFSGSYLNSGIITVIVSACLKSNSYVAFESSINPYLRP